MPRIITPYDLNATARRRKEAREKIDNNFRSLSDTKSPYDLSSHDGIAHRVSPRPKKNKKI